MAEVRGPERSREDTRWSLIAALLGAAAFVALAAMLVPWDPTHGLAPPPVAADSVFSAAQLERAEAYRLWARVCSWSSLAVSVAVACWLGFGRWGVRIADRSRGPRWLRLLTVVAALLVIGRLVTLPFAVALRQRQLEEGLATSSWPAWTLDLLLNLGLEIGVSTVAVLVLSWCARRWRRTWPVVAGGVVAALVVLGSFVYPVVVEPLFNDFRSLPDGELRSEIFALADAEGVPIDDVLVSDASRRTTTLNAYVSGFGDTRRVVVYDNLLDAAAREETLSVVAHELAHARHDDVLVGTALGATGAFAAVGLLGLVLVPLRRRGVELGQVRAVPAVLALVAVAGLLSAPIQNGISRHVELRADVVALDTTADLPGGVDAFIAVQQRLALRSLADPTPPTWSQWWFGSHPTVLERIALARSY
ncbi:M48 family metallopeptidase [Nocardioides panacisoli]|uniref:M48 family metallopeptidase n=1 Tax=Nocardioides panacisoli TaxID=627624 RepID=UPI001C624933|nr:M48 family metallopeptidase [Nocardioides panacisoli]QYJ04712.1 M48 family metallopeptidase [Nocardioides panacisoli]